MPDDFYESARALGEYLLFHYGEPEQILPYDFGPATALHFPVRCVSECLEVSLVPANARALDLGCAVGRSSFELARHCTEVIGVDYSHGFVQACRELAGTGYLDYQYSEEGQIMSSARAVVSDEIDRSRVRFERADASDLPLDLGSFDVILMANLLCRLGEPLRCLDRLGALTRPGGQLIVTTPCTWLEEYTPRENWLGGYERGATPIRTLETLKSVLRKDFEFITRRDLPFLIREHSRKFQWSVAEATVWQHRPINNDKC